MPRKPRPRVDAMRYELYAQPLQRSYVKLSDDIGESLTEAIQHAVIAQLRSPADRIAVAAVDTEGRMEMLEIDASTAIDCAVAMIRRANPKDLTDYVKIRVVR